MSCIFCSIASKEIQSNVVYETDTVIAFDDTNKQAPMHVLVIPKKHMTDMLGLGEILPDVFRAIVEVAKIRNIERSGYRVVVNSGKDAGQAVDHIHFHVLGGRALKWPPG